jgi:peptidoglycan/LPS O-acetylase OafA/YrhL
MNSLGATWLRPGFFRLFLASMVVLHHAGLCALGSWAVDVFFVLSGYWVCRMWWEKYRFRRHAVAVFFASRYWRLLPVYLVCQLIGLAVLWRFSPRWIAEISLMQSPPWILRALAIVSAGSQFRFLSPIWTLDIEMQFYLALPVLAWLLAQAFRLGPAVRGVLLIVVLAGLGLLFFDLPSGQPTVYLLPPYLLFFTLGMLVYFSDWRPSRRIGVASSILVGAIFLAIACRPEWRIFLGSEATRTANPQLQSVTTLLSGVLAVMVTPCAAFTVWQSSPSLDRHFGNLSYVLYLFHYPVQMAMDWAGPSLSYSALVLGVMQTGAVILGSLALYFCIDLPSEYRRRIFLQKYPSLPPAENSIRP